MTVARVITVAIAGGSLAVLCSCAASPGRHRESTVPSSSTANRNTGPAPVSTSWTSVPGPALAADSALVDISTPGPHDVWAVGYQKAAENNVGTTVLLHWDGSRWREAPRPGAVSGHLGSFATAIAAARPDDVWMVGSDAPGPSSAFASHWDGLRWTDRRPFGDQRGYLLRDGAAAGGKAWFVGSGPKGGIVVGWDGHAFQRVHEIGGGPGSLNSVSVEDGFLWAVGSVGDSDTPKAPLIYHEALGGDDPGQQETPDIPLGALTGIWPLSPSDVWAVGTLHCHGENCDRPLALHWDGSKWSRVDVPIQRGELYGVTATGKDDVWVSGIDLDHARQALFLHYDGRTWAREYGPAPAIARSADGDDDQVNRPGIARVPGASTLWSVGSTGAGTDDGDPARYFVLRNDGA